MVIAVMVTIPASYLTLTGGRSPVTQGPQTIDTVGGQEGALEEAFRAW